MEGLTVLWGPEKKERRRDIRVARTTETRQRGEVRQQGRKNHIIKGLTHAATETVSLCLFLYQELL